MVWLKRIEINKENEKQKITRKQESRVILIEAYLRDKSSL